MLLKIFSRRVVAIKPLLFVFYDGQFNLLFATVVQDLRAGNIILLIISIFLFWSTICDSWFHGRLLIERVKWL